MPGKSFQNWNRGISTHTQERREQNNFLSLVLDALISMNDHESNTDAKGTTRELLDRAISDSKAMLLDPEAGSQELYLAHFMLIVSAGDNLNQYHHHLSQLREHIADIPTMNVVVDYLKLQRNQYVPSQQAIKPNELNIAGLNLLTLICIEKQAPEVAIESFINFMKTIDLAAYHDAVITRLIKPIIDKITLTTFLNVLNDFKIERRYFRNYLERNYFVSSLTAIIRNICGNAMTIEQKNSHLICVISILNVNYTFHFRVLNPVFISLLTLMNPTDKNMTKSEQINGIRGIIEQLYALAALQLLPALASACRILNIPFDSDVIHTYTQELCDIQFEDPITKETYENAMKCSAILYKLADNFNRTTLTNILNIVELKIHQSSNIDKYSIKLLSDLNLLRNASLRRRETLKSPDNIRQNNPALTLENIQNDNGAGPSYIPEIFAPMSVRLSDETQIAAECPYESNNDIEIPMPLVSFDISIIEHYWNLICAFNQERANIDLNSKDLPTIIHNFKTLFSLYCHHAANTATESSERVAHLHYTLREVFFNNEEKLEKSLKNFLSEEIIPSLLTLRFFDEYSPLTRSTLKNIIQNNNQSFDELTVLYSQPTTESHPAKSIFTSALVSNYRIPEKNEFTNEFLLILMQTELECLIDGSYSPKLCELESNNNWCRSSLSFGSCSSYPGKTEYSEDDFFTPAFWFLKQCIQDEKIHSRAFYAIIVDLLTKLEQSENSVLWQCSPAITSIAWVAGEFLKQKDDNVDPNLQNQLNSKLIHLFLNKDFTTRTEESSLLKALDIKRFIDTSTDDEFEQIIADATNIISSTIHQRGLSIDAQKKQFLACHKAISLVLKISQKTLADNRNVQLARFLHAISEFLVQRFRDGVEKQLILSDELVNILHISNKLKHTSENQTLIANLYSTIQLKLIEFENSQNRELQHYFRDAMDPLGRSFPTMFQHTRHYVIQRNDEIILVDICKALNKAAVSLYSGDLASAKWKINARFSYIYSDDDAETLHFRREGPRYDKHTFFTRLVDIIQDMTIPPSVYWNIVKHVAQQYADPNTHAIALYWSDKTDTQMCVVLNHLYKEHDLPEDLFVQSIGYRSSGMKSPLIEMSDTDFKLTISRTLIQYNTSNAMSLSKKIEQLNIIDPFSETPQLSDDFMIHIKEMLRKMRIDRTASKRRFRLDLFSQLEKIYPQYFNTVENVLEESSDRILLTELQSAVHTVENNPLFSENTVLLLQRKIPARISASDTHTHLLSMNNRVHYTDFFQQLMTIIHSASPSNRARALYHILISLNTFDNVNDSDKNDIHNTLKNVLFIALSDHAFIDFIQESISNNLIISSISSISDSAFDIFLLPLDAGGMGFSESFLNRCITMLSSNTQAHSNQALQWINQYFPRKNLTAAHIEKLNCANRVLHLSPFSNLFFNISQPVFHQKLIALNFTENEIEKIRSLLQKFDSANNYQRNNEMLRSLLISTPTTPGEHLDSQLSSLDYNSVIKQLSEERDPIRQYYRARMLIVSAIATLVTATAVVGYVFAAPMITAFITGIIAAIMLASAAVTCVVLHYTCERKISLTSMLLDVAQRQHQQILAKCSDDLLSQSGANPRETIEAVNTVNPSGDSRIESGAGVLVSQDEETRTFRPSISNN